MFFSLKHSVEKLSTKSLAEINFNSSSYIEELLNNSSDRCAIKLKSKYVFSFEESELENHFNQKFWQLEGNHKDLEFKEHILYSFKDVVTNPRHGIVILEKDKFLHESSCYTGKKKIFGLERHKNDNFFEVPVKFLKNIKESKYPILFALSTSPVNNYCHFNLDVISGLLPVLDHIRNNKIKLLVGHKLLPYQKSLLDILGLDEDHCFISKDKLIKCPRLIKSSSNFHLYKKFLSSSVLDLFPFLANQLTSAVDIENTYPERVYLKRTKSTSKRQVKWHGMSQLEDMLKKYNYSFIDPGKLSIPEQIRLFGSAKFIVGEHGAAFTNTGYCNSECVIIEILPDTRITKLFYQISKSAGANHIVLPAESSRIKEGKNINDFEYHVPLNDLSSLLSNIH